MNYSVQHTYRLQHLFDHRDTPVESRKVFAFDTAELNLFETVQPAERFALRFPDPVIAIMLKGKKVMHVGRKQSFDFFPGQSVILNSHEQMLIDFPEARETDPTRCIALTLSNDLIKHTVERANDQLLRLDGHAWELDYEQFFLSNDDHLDSLVRRLLYLYMEDVYGKKLLTQHSLEELVLRIMQTQARQMLLSDDPGRHRLAEVVQFIRRNICENFSIDDLARRSYLSRPQFFRVFKQELGITPIELVNKERLRFAKRILLDSGDITQACFAAGFNSLSYFHRVFKKEERKTPMAWLAENI
ncbi:MAG TPA: AraC family transcriptional regulator [Saprospiraceae bacterium]|nr:AraC family transcriptional regulator [Saprospiraceae bacterium]